MDHSGKGSHKGGDTHNMGTFHNNDDGVHNGDAHKDYSVLVGSSHDKEKEKDLESFSHLLSF